MIGDLNVGLGFTTIGFFLFASLLIAIPSTAQQFIGGSVLVSHQAEGNIGPVSDPSLPRNGIGGNGIGVGILGGVFISPRVALGTEFSMATAWDAVQTSPRSQDQISFRDFILSQTFRLRAAPGFEIISGASYVRESTTRRTAIPETVGRDTFGLVGGIDFPITLGAHLLLTPQLRLHLIYRADVSEGPGRATFGLGPVVWRPAIGIMLKTDRP